jgi:hypothetical protein
MLRGRRSRPKEGDMPSGYGASRMRVLQAKQRKSRPVIWLCRGSTLAWRLGRPSEPESQLRVILGSTGACLKVC